MNTTTRSAGSGKKFGRRAKNFTSPNPRFTPWVFYFGQKSNRKQIAALATKAMFDSVRGMEKGKTDWNGNWKTCRVGKPTLEKLVLRLASPARLFTCLALLTLLSSAYSQPLGPLTASSTINLNGNRSVIDSFDSSDPAHSVWQTNWFYNGSHYGTYKNTLRKDNAIVATDDQLIQAGSIIVYGYVDTGPGGTVSITSSGSVGDLGWIGTDPNTPNNHGIQTGHQRDNMNAPFPPVAIPTATTWFSISTPTNYTIIVGGQIYTNNNSNPYKSGKPSSYTIGGNSYSLFITNITALSSTPTNKIYYQYASQLSQSIFIDASNVVLYLPNGIQLGAGDNFTLNTNADVQVYSGKSIGTASGLVNNLPQYALALKFYGLSACTNVNFGGNPNLMAWLYAPQASISFNGGSSVYDVTGVIIAHDIIVNGHYNFHYDEALNPSLPFPPWISAQTICQAVEVGSDTFFTVETTGGFTTNYTWFFNQTNRLTNNLSLQTLSLTNVQLSDAGYYSVTVSNPFGYASSMPARLYVYTNALEIAAFINKPYAWTNGGGNLKIDFSGITGLYYIAQTSTNLTDWISIRTNTPPFFVTDPNFHTRPQQFYRAVYLPLP